MAARFKVNERKLLIVIILLAAFLRLYKLGSYPVSLSWDEVAIGYNAFSIAQTSKDEYGSYLPVLFKSFNDYKLPGYIYLDSLFVKILGLSEFSTRVPSALLGVLAVVVTYFLTKEIFKKEQNKSPLALAAALVMAISPWHLQLSRAAFESNASLTFILTGLLLLFVGMRFPVAALFSVPALVLSLYFYYSPRVFVPLILLTTFFIYRKKLMGNLKAYVLGVFLSLIILLPLAISIFSTEGFKRLKEVSIFQDQSLIVDYVATRATAHSPLAFIFLNRRIPTVFEGFHNYFSHFSPGFLFFGDDPNPRHRSAFHGNLYLFEIPTLVGGLIVLYRMKDKNLKSFLLAWLLLGPLPAAFTKETPHALRAILLMPPIVIISAMGTIFLLKKSFVKIIFPVAAILLFVNYLYSYYFVYPQRDSLSWAYGYKNLYQKLAVIDQSYDRVIITGYYWKPYIFYLFYNRINPITYQESSSQEVIGKYRFGTAGWDTNGQDLNEQLIEGLKGQKTLLAIAPGEFEKLEDKTKFKLYDVIYDFPGRKKVFLIGQWI